MRVVSEIDREAQARAQMHLQKHSGSRAATGDRKAASQSAMGFGDTISISDSDSDTSASSDGDTSTSGDSDSDGPGGRGRGSGSESDGGFDSDVCIDVDAEEAAAKARIVATIAAMSSHATAMELRVDDIALVTAPAGLMGPIETSSDFDDNGDGGDDDADDDGADGGSDGELLSESDTEGEARAKPTLFVRQELGVVPAANGTPSRAAPPGQLVKREPGSAAPSSSHSSSSSLLPSLQPSSLTPSSKSSSSAISVSDNSSGISIRSSSSRRSNNSSNNNTTRGNRFATSGPRSNTISPSASFAGKASAAAVAAAATSAVGSAMGSVTDSVVDAVGPDGLPTVATVHSTARGLVLRISGRAAIAAVRASARAARAAGSPALLEYFRGSDTGSDSDASDVSSRDSLDENGAGKSHQKQASHHISSAALRRDGCGVG